MLFDLVRALNAAIDAGEVGSERRRGDPRGVRPVRPRPRLIALRRAEEAAPPVPVDEIERLIDERREAARSAATSPRADAIRQDLDARGILLEDSPAGTRWKRG